MPVQPETGNLVVFLVLVRVRSVAKGLAVPGVKRQDRPTPELPSAR